MGMNGIEPRLEEILLKIHNTLLDIEKMIAKPNMPLYIAENYMDKAETQTILNCSRLFELQRSQKEQGSE